MATIPQPRSYEQIVGDLIDALRARLGLSDLRPGSGTLSFIEAAAQSDFRSSQDIFAILDANSVDRATGNELDLVGNDNNVPRLMSAPATGEVTVTDGSFTKISSKVYPGTVPPNIGSTALNVSDASQFQNTGAVYIGRNTANFEGPIGYTAVTQIGAYWQLALATPTTKFHNLSESVIVKQGGNRTISAGTLVQTPQGNVSVAVQFQTTLSTIIPDGETTITGVPVVALTPGSIGRVPRGAISEVPSAPIPNLSATNPLPFVTGQDRESDTDYRDRIKRAIQSRSKGTAVAIENSVLGVTSPDEPKRVVSSKVIEQVGLPTRLIVDDGAGYEELSTGVGLVSVIDSALGGEKYLQLPDRVVVRAQLITTLDSPFVLSDHAILAVMVGGVRSEHTFYAAEFKTIGNATAFEVASSINGDAALLFSAATTDGGNRVRIFAQVDTHEDLQVTVPTLGTNANLTLGFIDFQTFTLNLYKNDILLHKDGVVPQIFSVAQSSWNPAIASGDTITVNVDGTGPATYTINDSDFVINNTGYLTVNAFNSLASWAIVFNAKIAGVTCLVSGNQLVFQSNKGASATASLAITGGSLVTNGMFAVSSSQGLANDYEFNRNKGQITLAVPLVSTDRVTAGSSFTQGYVQSGVVPGSTVDFLTTAKLWVIVDGNAQPVVIDVPSASTLAVTNPGAGVVWRYRIVGNATAFAAINPGDWLVVLDSAITDATNLGYWRVAATGLQGGTDSYVEVEKSAGVVASYVLVGVGAGGGLMAARSSEPMQQIALAPGVTIPLTTIAALINLQLLGATASVAAGSRLRLTTLAYGTSKGIMYVAANFEGRKLLFTDATSVLNKTSHTAFVESGNDELGTPLFVHDVVATGTAVEPPLSIASTVNLVAVAGASASHMIGFLRPIGVSDRFSSNRNNHLQLQDIVTTALTLNPKATVHEVLTNDRIFPATPYDLDSEDSLVTVLDQDEINKTFDIRMARRIAVAGVPVPPSSSKFYIYDLDQGPVATPDLAFGTAFKFDNFKLWMKARTVLDPDGAKNAIVYRFADYGPGGDVCRIGYFLPIASNLALGSSVTTGQYTSINIVLASGNARSLSHDGTTTFSVAVVGAGPYDVTYTRVGGPSPDFIVNGVVVGDILTITNASSLLAANIGTWRITARTASTITVRRSDAGTADGAKALNVASALQVYPIDPACTAAAVVSYVNTNLSSYVSAILTTYDPPATPNDGSGVIATSTDGDTGFLGTPYVVLQDGENWILSTDLTGGTENLVLKKTLAFSSALYSLTGEEMRLIATTADQFSRYLNVLGTSGIVTVAGLSTTSHDNKLQIYSDVLGSSGSVQVTGGTANITGAPVLGSAATVDTSYTKLRIASALKRGFHANQWVRVTSSSVQPKALGFDASTTALSVTVTAGLVNTIDITAGPGTFRTAKPHSGDATTEFQLEKQGSFMALVHSGFTAPAFVGAGIVEGDWVTLGTAFTAVNRGTFRVVRVYGNSIYFENPLGVEEIVVPGAGNPTFVSYDSVLPGDTLSIGNNILGAANVGSFVVVAVNSPSQLVVNGTMVNAGPTVLGASNTQVQILEGVAFQAVKQIHTIAINPSTSDQLDVILRGTALNSKISVVGGATLEALNKFNFNTDIQPGIDAYRKYQGLILESNRVVYGDPLSPTSYPGVKAAGAQLNIEGPIVKRITVALSVRVRTGTPFSLVEDQIRSSVAAAINLVPLGNPVVLSDIVSAAGSVDGVLAVSVVSPTFDSTHDLITVQAFEKPLVIDADADITISQVGA